MANFNKVILVGRLTRDIETRAFQNGGMVAKFGLAVSGRKKNSQTGQFEDDPMYMDCEVFNRGETFKLADFVRDTCHKGSQVLVEGKLHLETWDDKNNPGTKRQKHKLVVDVVQLLDPKPAGDGQQGGGQPQQGGSRFSPPPRQNAPQDAGNPDDIPF